MFSKRGSVVLTKGKPLRARQTSLEIKASSTGEFMRADKFEKSEQGGSRALNFIYCAAAVQGFRSRIQDEYACTPNIEIKGIPYAHFGVFDGHGDQGEVISQHCADTTLKLLLNRKALKQSKVVTNELLAASVHKTIIKMDTELRGVVGMDGKPQFLSGGTTACFVLVSQDDIMFVNVGDSRAVLCRDGGVVYETSDHNPNVPEEEERIVAAGGNVHTTPSKHKVITDIEGFSNLSVSRTLGDFNFKPPSTLPPELQAVTPAPDINVVSRDLATDEFLVVASDGIFKSLSSIQVVQFVQRQLIITDDLSKICRNLIDTAYFAAGNIPDDTTVILVKFPAAPSVSQQAIAEENLLDLEAMAAIEEELKVMIDKADSIRAVDNDFSISQRLVQKLPEKYRVQQRIDFITETATRLKSEKFEGKSGDNPRTMPLVTTTNENASSSEKDHQAVVAMSNEDSEHNPSTECVADGDGQSESPKVFEKTACVKTNSDGETAKSDEVFPLNNEQGEKNGT